MITIEYDGEPQRKERPRFNTKTGHAFTPRKTKDAEERIAQYARYQNVGAELPLDGELAITLSFRTTHDGSNPIGRIDIDNATKLVMDALNGVIWHDDWQISELYASLVRGADEGFTRVTIRQLHRD